MAAGEERNDGAGEQQDAGNRDVLYRNYYDDMQKRFLRQVVSQEVIDEHRRNPLGQHSEPLARLLHFFRTQPLSRQYAVRREGANSLRIVALSGQRGVAPRTVDEQRFEKVEDAYHAIFLMQIKELLGA